MPFLKKRKFFVCTCWFRQNIFLKDYKLHVEYDNDETFLSKYEPLFLDKYAVSAERLKQDVLPLVRSEVEKRRDRGKLYLERCLYVEQNYAPLHPQVYTLEASFLHPAFIEIVKYCKSAGSSKEGLLSLIKKDPIDVIYSSFILN